MCLCSVCVCVCASVHVHYDTQHHTIVFRAPRKGACVLLCVVKPITGNRAEIHSRMLSCSNIWKSEPRSAALVAVFKRVLYFRLTAIQVHKRALDVRTAVSIRQKETNIHKNPLTSVSLVHAPPLLPHRLSLLPLVRSNSWESYEK